MTNKKYQSWKYALAFMLILGSSAATSLFAQAYQLTFSIKNYSESTMILAYHNGPQQFIKDTLTAQSAGTFVAKGNESLQAGMYIAFFPAVGKSFDFLVNADEQKFTLETDTEDLIGKMKVKNSVENERFFGYLNYLGAERNERNATAALLEKLKTEDERGNSGKIADLETKMKDIDEKVIAYQKNIVAKYPASFTAGIIKINTPIDIPEEIRKDTVGAFAFYKKHFFDNVNFADERFIYSPMFHPKIDLYISEKVTVPHPDSAIATVDFLLKKAEANEKVFRFCLIRLLNEYAKSKIVCMDAVYVHLVDNYYAKGRADWIDAAQLAKIKEDADALRPLLCNRVAPDVMMQTFDVPAKPVNLHGIKAKYTVLFMWDPDCGHCKKSMPDMVKFTDEFKSKGVEVFAVCTKTYQGAEECTKNISERDMGRMLNVIDPYYQSRYKQLYNVKSTPIIYILDADKKILAKRVGAEQLAEVMERFIKRDEQLIKQN